MNRLYAAPIHPGNAEVPIGTPPGPWLSSAHVTNGVNVEDGMTRWT